MPEYPAHINHLVSESKSCCSIEIGMPFDVEVLLSGGKSELNYLVRNDGERVEVERTLFINKYIMVCCFHVPVFYEDKDSGFIQYLISTVSELYARGESFEMVVVVKMKKLANHEVIFNLFLSGFPSWCLVIPFEDSQRHDFICNYLNLDDCYSIRCLLLDKDKDMKRNILHNGFPDYLFRYGADAFPFTIEKLQELEEDEEPAWKTPSTYKLERLLGCDPSAVLEKINAEDDRDVVTVSELNKEDVGLYMCIQGDFLPVLEKVYEQCRIQQKPFEIVLVYVPFLEALDPKKYTVYVDNLLQKYKIFVWRLPFNNSVSRKIWRLTRFSAYDRLIVCGANNAFVEPRGGDVMRCRGIDAYPFSREGLIQREVNKLEKLTLDSLLVYQSRDYVYRGGKRIPVASLRGKNVVVCIDSHRHPEFSDKLNIWYEEIKRKNNSAFEMVYVHAYHTNEVLADLSVSADMPWLVCPFNPKHSSSLEKTLFMKAGLGDALVEFGIDGHVCSLNTKHLLSTHGSESFPFGRSNLRQDVLGNFHRLYDFMDDIRN